MKLNIVLFLSYVTSITATASPSHRPSRNPSESPSNRPSRDPSESPSNRPSTDPSSRPSRNPSESPSNRPSRNPSESPSNRPSTDPSSAPSCTPSKAPSPQPSVHLFYPDQSGEAHGCLNDGGQAAWMESNPTQWLFSTLEKCCKQHFSWNYDVCMGTHDQTCARALWYPDWEGDNKGCVRDGDEPYYMTQNPGNFLFSTKGDCCKEHYSWSYSTCTGGGTSSSGAKYYADWTSGDDTCKNDGEAPEYMVDQPSTWLYDSKDKCCARYFSYKLTGCMGTSASTGGTGKYYPDWSGDNEGCLVDSGSTPAPEYMRESGTWFSDTLDKCCAAHYNYNISGCKGASPSSTGTTTVTGTNKWYVDWTTFECFKDCATGGTDSDCGGFAGVWTQLHTTKQICCQTHVSWDYKHCVA